MRKWPSFARASSGGTFPMLVGFCQGTVIPPPPPCTHSFDVVKLKKREKVLTRQPEIDGGSGSGGRMEMMRMTARTERMRTIVRRCWAVPKKMQTYPGRHVTRDKLNKKFIKGFPGRQSIPGDMSPGKVGGKILRNYPGRHVARDGYH
ncbi:hypothetical protein Tco_1498184 [Tanacetum coccineum]